MKKLIAYLINYKFLFLIILPAFFLYMLVIFPSGSYTCVNGECGIYFWGVHGRDAIWHLAITANSFDKIPFTTPIYAGEKLYGYNWLLDLFIFILTKVNISALFSYFKLIPILWFIIFTSLLIILARKIKDTPLFVGLFLLISYFAGSFSYFLTLYHNKTIQNSSQLFPQPIIHSMSNLQYAISLIFFILLFIVIKSKRINIKVIIISGILLFILLGIKFYAGAIAIFSFFLFIFLNVFQERQDGRKKIITRFIFYCFVISVFIVSSIIIFYDPFNTLKTGSSFAFVPFAIVHTITESADQFYLRGLTDARYYLMSRGVSPRLILIEGLNLVIFLFFYLGTRVFGLIYAVVLLLRRKLERFDVIILSTIGFSILLTVTLVQKGVWWNTIQFFFYAIFLLTIYLSKLIYDLITSKRKFPIIIGIILILLSIPTSYDLMHHFLNSSKPIFISKDEIEALSFLKKQPQGVVLNQLYKGSEYFQDKIPINQIEDSSYVAAFSEKQLYIAEFQTLTVSSISFEKRLARVNNNDCSILNEVDYIYEIKTLPKSKRLIMKCFSNKIRKIFENKLVTIYSSLKNF